MQLSALADEFLLDCRARRLSPRTITWYRSNLRYFLDWLAGEGEPDRLASFTLQQARRYSHMLAERSALQATFVSGGKKHGVHAMIETDRPLSANTVSGYLRTLKVFSRWLAAEEQGYLERTCWPGCGCRSARRPTRSRAPRPRWSGCWPTTTCGGRAACATSRSSSPTWGPGCGRPS